MTWTRRNSNARLHTRSPLNKPMTPGSYLSGVMNKKLSLSEQKKVDRVAEKKRLLEERRENDRQARAEREEARNRRPWLQLLHALNPTDASNITVQHLQKMTDTVSHRCNRVLQMKEGLSCMSATQRDKVFRSLHKLENAMGEICNHLAVFLGERDASSESSLSFESYTQDSTVLNCKKGILSSQAGLDEIKERIHRLASLPQCAECLQGVTSSQMKDVEDGSRELEDTFGLVALFAPVQALRQIGSFKKAAGQALLKKFGVEGTRVDETFLDGKLQKLFHEIDADGGGDIDMDEMKDGLENLGVRIPDAELHKLLQEFDDDGSLTIDPEEFKTMCKGFLRDCNVVIVSAKRDKTTSICRSTRPAALLVLDEDEEKVQGTSAATKSGRRSNRSSARRSSVSSVLSGRRRSLRSGISDVAYSHLCTSPHILKQRMVSEIGLTKKAMTGSPVRKKNSRVLCLDKKKKKPSKH